MSDKCDKKFKEAKILAQNNNINEAYKKLRKLYKLNPNNNSEKFELAILMINMGEEKIDIAEKYLLEIYNYNHHSTAKLYLGRIMLKKKEFDRARRCFNELIGTNSEADALIELGRMNESLGNIKLATKYYAVARKILKKRYNSNIQSNYENDNYLLDSTYEEENYIYKVKKNKSIVL